MNSLNNTLHAVHVFNTYKDISTYMHASEHNLECFLFYTSAFMMAPKTSAIG